MLVHDMKKMYYERLGKYQTKLQIIAYKKMNTPDLIPTIDIQKIGHNKTTPIHAHASHVDPDTEDTIDQVKQQLLKEYDEKLVMTVNWTDMHKSLEKCFLVDPIKPAGSSAIALELFEGNTLNFEV